MTPQKALVYRVGVGKAIGLAFSIFGFYVIPYFIHDASLMFRWAVLLWYPTLGAIVGVFGLFSYHPVLNFPMPWWLRGAIVGAWMNFVLTLFAYEQICTAVLVMMSEYGAYASPFYMVIEGAFVGALMDFFLTRWFGEGWSDKAAPG